MTRYWFKQKRYGFGGVPVTWQGWALTLGYIAMLATLAALLGGDPLRPDGLKFFAVGFVLTIFFIGVSWRTTEGGWRWRWGDKT